MALRVFGRASVNRMAAGRNDLPSRSATRSASSDRSSDDSEAPSTSTTKPHRTSPFTSSGTPTAAASTTDGCDTSADSTSAGPSRFPASLIVSSLRPCRNQSPSSSTEAQSPCTHTSGHRDQYVAR